MLGDGGLRGEVLSYEGGGVGRGEQGGEEGVGGCAEGGGALLLGGGGHGFVLVFLVFGFP